MTTGLVTLAYAYLRLSREEAKNGESSSIKNQRDIITSYCKSHGITLLHVFTDDGWSGGNFDRPGFQEMMRELEKGKVNMVITKDLSRLGRDMRESSYYAEQFFPEHGIRYLTIADNFDTEHENVMAPFQFAMNEVYLRDGSRKVKDVLRNKRENGQYCCCPPYGYKKEPTNKNHLIPDEITAPVVQRVFARAAKGDSCRTIAMELNRDGVIPPLKYRVLYRDEFSDEGAARASDVWNYTTVKRILKNRVYLGHTILGKSRKASVKSKKKLAVPEQDWAITPNTHVPLVTEAEFELAQKNMGRGTKNYQAYDHVRKSIFSGIAVCGRCGYSLCSCGTVYKGEREKYWYLSCTHQRQDILDPCDGVRIRYADLLELIKADLNSLLDLSDEAVECLIQNVYKKAQGENSQQERKLQREKANARLATISKIIAKLYTDNAEGHLSDERLFQMVEELEREAKGLNQLLSELEIPDPAAEIAENYRQFFELAKQYSHIDTLDRDTLVTFVERIEVGPKLLPDGVEMATHRNQPYRQVVRIFYKFIGELEEEPIRDLPVTTAS